MKYDSCRVKPIINVYAVCVSYTGYKVYKYYPVSGMNIKPNVFFVDVLKELVLLSPHDFLHTLVPFLQHNHCTYHHSNIPSMYFQIIKIC